MQEFGEVETRCRDEGQDRREGRPPNLWRPLRLDDEAFRRCEAAVLRDPGPPLPPRDELVVEDVSDGDWDALFEALEDV
ncbi:MAG: hypothetical protein U0U69_12455 [Acidimicrobiia bacterium]